MAVEEADRPRAGGIPAAADGPGVDPRLRDRLRTAVCCLALTALAFCTRPGAILAETKIDMAVNPLGFLGRALHLWDTGQFGQLQNQAAGYLFPMGPFYALADLLGLPAWIAQRCWLALLMCLAFLGVRLLAARLGIGGPDSRLAGAMAYALAPNALATLGQISSEYMPVAMLPWIMLPLVTAAGAADRRGGRVRAAARSGLAVACCGGINATATAAVLVVPFLYLVTRPRDRGPGAVRLRRARLLGWWSAAVAAATAWWLVPLLLTGTYGFSWLTYTEKAATTTGPTGLINVLRGAERWVNYLVVDGQVWSPAGHGLSLDPLPVLCTGLVAALGLAGLVTRLLPERAFLLLTLLAGLAIVSAGHLGALPGPFAGQVRELLDGPLGPLRNLHKFDAVVRLPLALGLAHLLTVASRARLARGPRAPRAGRGPVFRTAAVPALAPALAVVALGGIAATGVSRGLTGPGEFAQVPRYWKDAASWLNAHAGRQGVLALPGAPFGEYVWGRPMDDIVQPLLTARWGVRQLVPAGSPGYTRALDAVDRQVRSGRASPGLAAFLGRMGVRYVLVRNDLRREGLRGGWPARLRQSLQASPGLRKAASFGDPVGHDPADDAVSSLDQPSPALEVYEVEDAEAVATLSGAAAPARVYGGPESLLALSEAEALPEGPALIGDDAADLGGTPVISDSPRLLRREFGELHQTSPTLTAAERDRAADITDDAWEAYTTTVAYDGVRDVTASSSAGGHDAIPQARRPGAIPYAALDGDPASAWETGGWRGPVGQWLKVDFGTAREIPGLSATFVQDGRLGPPVARVAVETERGTVEQPVRAVAGAQPLRAAPGATRWLRLRITGLASAPAAPMFARAAVSELSVQGVRPGRTYRLPAPAGLTGDPSYVMSRVPGAAPECMKGVRRWVCSDSLGARGEEGDGFDRTFTAGRAGRTALAGTAVLTDPRLIARYTAAPGRPRVTASSALSFHPAAQARSAFDDDPATTWIAAAGDRAPVYTVRWDRERTISSITLRRPPGAAGPVQVRIEGRGGRTREAIPDDLGRLTFAPLRTDRLTLTFRRGGGLQPLQITDVVVPGVRSLPDVRTFPLTLDCGFGPRLSLDGRTVPTKVTGTLGDLLEGRPVAFEACRPVTLREGPNRLAAEPLDGFRVESAVVGDRAAAGEPGEQAASGEDAAPGEQAARPVRVLRWTAGERAVRVDAAQASFLTVNENYNPGWTARAGGKKLRPVRLDGWKQGWVVPAGTTGTVELTFRPDVAHRAGVVGGLGLLVVLLLVAVRPRGARPVPPPPPAGAPGWPAWAAVALAAVLGGWIAGVPGLAVTAATAALCGWTRTRGSPLWRASTAPWTAAVLMAAGTGCLAAGLWTGVLDDAASPSGAVGDAVPQLLGLVIIGLLAQELWRPGRRPGADPEGAFEVSWARADGPAAGPDVPPTRSSPSPLRWTPPGGEADPSPRPPGTAGPSTRTSPR
ncbi:DUF3367 domain-containing protein [Actinomadura viridis]|uniref:Arabinofuranan 3-O-arabinosyltransferase n=1 Tax=Actinomadura viridis TaxID=58110 RepID=A0A931GGW7_9ACTN|nr:arabinofuranan 3-O-arabinosyltransferase [Actinomadura viridis]